MTDTSLQVTTPMGLLQLAIEKEGSIDVIERLAKLQQDFLDREAKVAFAQAFADFKANVPKILKTKHVQFTNKAGSTTDYWHVELDKAIDLLAPALLQVGITHRWVSADLPDGRVRVTCYLKHRLGYEEMGATLAGPVDQSGGKNPIQGVGSSSTYLERYTLLMTCGIAPEGKDDDATLSGVTQEQADEHLAAMKDAADAKSVMGAWKKAIECAKSLTPIDYRAMTIFTEARDKRLLELKNG